VRRESNLQLTVKEQAFFATVPNKIKALTRPILVGDNHDGDAIGHT